VTFDPSAPGTPVPATIAAGSPLRGVACPSVSQCTAVGDDVDGMQVTFNPSVPGTASATIIAAGRNQPVAVACPSVSQCTAVTLRGNEVTFNPAAPGSPTLNTVDGGNPLRGVACPSVSECVAVDDYGRVVEGDPAHPDSFALVPVAGANSLTAVACSSVAQCVTVDQVGNGFVGSGPVPAPGPSPGPGPGSGPGPSPGPGPGTGPPTRRPPPPPGRMLAPVVTGYGLTNNMFAVSGDTPRFGRAAKAGRHRKGTTFRYTLSEAATVGIVITQRASGRRRGRRCVAATGRRRPPRRCTLIVTSGTLTRISHHGANRVGFSGRIGSKALRPGRYQATLTATNATRQTSTRQTVAFTVVKR